MGLVMVGTKSAQAIEDMVAVRKFLYTQISHLLKKYATIIFPYSFLVDVYQVMFEILFIRTG